MKDILAIFGIIVIIIVVIIIIVITVITRKKHTNTKTTDKSVSEPKLKHEHKKPENAENKNLNYISPMDFNVGIFKSLGKKYANNCVENKLWPFKLPYVYYDDKAPKEDCECLEFIQPP